MITITDKIKELIQDKRGGINALIYRSSDVKMEAGFEEIAEKILTLPPSSSISTIIDDTISLTKNAPVDSTKYCYLKSLGGMTYKCNNLIPYPYHNTTNTSKGITFTDNGDGTITLNGTAESNVGFTFQLKNSFTLPKGTYTLSGFPSGLNASCYLIVSVYNGSTWVGEFLDNGKGITKNISNLTYTGCQVSIHISAGTVCNNLVVKPMLNTGSTALPYEPYYEGLRDNKATAIKVSGANLAHFVGWSATPGDDGVKAISNRYGTTINTTDMVNSITVTQTAQGNSSYPSSFANGFFHYMLSEHLIVGKKYRVSFDLKVISNPINASVILVMPNGEAGVRFADGDLPIVGETKRVSGVITYKKHPTYLERHLLEIRNCGMDCVISNVMITEEAVIDTTYKPLREPITYDIPQELQGTGKGVEGAADTVDFENGKAITNCITVVFDGTETGWDYRADYHCILQNGAILKAVGKGDGYIVSNLPINITYSNAHKNRFQIGGTSNPIENYGITSTDEWKAYLTELYTSSNPFTVTYAVAEPITEDIDTSAFDPLIEVEPGGSIEFITDNGLAPNSTIIYQTLV